jgi:hypothetical protein
VKTNMIKTKNRFIVIFRVKAVLKVSTDFFNVQDQSYHVFVAVLKSVTPVVIL